MTPPANPRTTASVNGRTKRRRTPANSADKAPQRGPALGVFGEALAARAAAIWRAQSWEVSHGSLSGPLVGAASVKPLARRLWLLAIAVAAAMPAGGDLSLRVVADHRINAPVAMALSRTSPPQAVRVPIDFDDQTLIVGDRPRIDMEAPGSTGAALRTFAAVVETYVKAPSHV